MATTPSPRHRIITARIVLVSVVVGVVLAVASVPVAAFVVTQSYWAGRNGILNDEEPASLTEVRSIGFQMLEVHVGYHTGAHFRMLDPTDDPRPPYARPAIYPGFMLWYVRAGWPWFAAEGRKLQRDPTPGFLVETTIFANRWWIPLRPIWPGLLANTLFYAALVFLPLAGLRLARSRRRRRRGLCVACGYELGHGIAVCPECGLGATRESE